MKMKQHSAAGMQVQTATTNTETKGTTFTMKDGQTSPTGSDNSTLGGYPHMRRLVEMLINEFYRKRNKSIKTVTREK